MRKKSSSRFAHLLAVLVAATVPVVSQAASQYVTPEGAGDRSGRDWANARPGKSGGLQAGWDATGPGDTLYVGSGRYDRVSLRITSGGESGRERKVVGTDTGQGLPRFTSDFSRTNLSGGSTLIDISQRVSHVTISGLRVEGYNIVVRLRGGNEQVTIDDVDATGVRDAFWVEGAATPTDATLANRRVTLRNLDVTNFTKRGVRVFGGNSDMLVENCHMDAGGRDWAVEVFPIGFHLNTTTAGVWDERVKFVNCSAANAWNDAGTNYWNADGFCAEGQSRDISYINCLAWGNTDGGWDLKSTGITLVNCVGIDNKRNFRFWTSASMENCLSAFSNDRGKLGHDLGVWLNSGANLTMRRCTLWGDRVGVSVEGDNSKTSRVNIDTTLLAIASGGTHLKKVASTVVTETASVRSTTEAREPKLRNPSASWRGGDDAFDVVDYANLGYRWGLKPPANPSTRVSPKRGVNDR